MKLFFDWLLNRPTDQLGNAVFVLTLCWVALCLLLAHLRGQIDLWEVVRTTDRNGVERTDGAKLFIAGAFFVMTVTFYYLAVTKQLSEWYVLIYAASWLGERFRRDFMRLKELTMLKSDKETK